MAAGTGAMFRARTDFDAQLLLREHALRHRGRRPHTRQALTRVGLTGAPALAAAWSLAALLD